VVEFALLQIGVQYIKLARADTGNKNIVTILIPCSAGYVVRCKLIAL
jgi:hypothetical protein